MSEDQDDQHMMLWSEKLAPDVQEKNEETVRSYKGGVLEVGHVHRCSVCHKSYTSPSHLQRHIKTIHAGAEVLNSPKKIAPPLASEVLVEAPVGPTATEPPPLYNQKRSYAHRCVVCRKTFTSPSHLQRHVKTIHGAGKGLEKGECQTKPENPAPVMTRKMKEKLIIKSRTSSQKLLKKSKMSSKKMMSSKKITYQSETSSEIPESLSEGSSQKTESGLTEEQERLLRMWSEKAGPDPDETEEGMVLPQAAEGGASKRIVQVQCALCDKSFSSKCHLRRHFKKSHGVGAKLSGSHQCSVCQTCFTSECHLQRHFKRFHTDDNFTMRKKTITCPVCTIKVRNLASLSEHIKKSHPETGVAEHQTIQFANKQDFEKWKMEEERRTCSGFMRRRGMDCKNVLRYYCRRSGTYERRGTGRRQTKSQGTCKVGATCPAFIKAAFSPTGVFVTYSFVHVGHDTDLKHLDLSAAERQQIAAMIQAGIQFDDILTQVRDNLSATQLSRLHLIQRRDLNNIARDFNLLEHANRKGDGSPRKPRGAPLALGGGAAAIRPPVKRRRCVKEDLTEIDNMITYIRGALESGDRNAIAVAMKGLKSVTTEVNTAVLAPQGKSEGTLMSTLGGVQLGNATINGATLGSATLDNAMLGNATFGNVAIGSRPFGNGSLGNGPLGNGPLGNGPLGNGPLTNGPLGNGPLVIGGGPLGNVSLGGGPLGNVMLGNVAHGTHGGMRSIAEMPSTSMMLPSASYLVL